MYIVTNKNGTIIGYHSCEDVVFEYVFKYNKYSEKDEAKFDYVKDKKFYKYLKHHKEDERKYLLRFHETYIPEMYLDSESLCDTGFIKDVKYARDTIDTLMSCYDNLDDKDMNRLGKAYRILSDVIKDADNYTADYKQLTYNKQHIAEISSPDSWLHYDI